jgi:hypothetical protein
MNLIELPCINYDPTSYHHPSLLHIIGIKPCLFPSCHYLIQSTRIPQWNEDSNHHRFFQFRTLPLRIDPSIHSQSITWISTPVTPSFMEVSLHLFNSTAQFKWDKKIHPLPVYRITRYHAYTYRPIPKKKKTLNLNKTEKTCLRMMYIPYPSYPSSSFHQTS